MADAKEMSAEAAKLLVEAVLKQSELLGSWALAVFGAGILLVVWYVQRQSEVSKQPPIKARYLIFISISLEGASILLMYFAYGILVNLIPELQFAKIDTADSFYTFLENNASFNHARTLFWLQFWFFFGGILSLGIFGLCNSHLMRSRMPKSGVSPPVRP